MRLTALVDSLDHVCCRYRLAAYRPFLQRAGYHLELQPLPGHWWERLRMLRGLRQTDAVILQRKLLQPWQVYLLRRAAPLILFDFDDAVFLRDSYSSKGLHSADRLRKFAATVRAANAVVAGNDFLCEQAAAASSADRVHRVPTCVEPRSYPLAEHWRRGPGVQLVWIGSSSTLHGLEAIQPLLEQLGQYWQGIRLKLICDRFLELHYLPIIPCAWKLRTEADELAAADIGISWLPDDLWSRGKCGLKVLQYMAAGLPVVANPVGVQADMIKHGETGFLVETPRQWAEAIGKLVHNPDLRRRMGRAGRRRVEAEFSVVAGAARWITLLRGFRRRRDAA